MAGYGLPKDLSFSKLRASYIAGNLNDATGDSALDLATNTKLSHFRTAIMADAPAVPSGSAAISIGTVFRGKTFGANNSFTQITNSPFSGTQTPSTTGVFNDEFIFIFTKDGSGDGSTDIATVSFIHSTSSGSSVIYQVINIGGSASYAWDNGIGVGSTPKNIYDYPITYNTSTTSAAYAWDKTSGTEGLTNSKWASTNGIGSTLGDHTSISYLKVRIGPLTTGTTTIAMTVNSEANYDKLYVYKNPYVAPASGTVTCLLTFRDTWGDGYINSGSNDAGIYVRTTASTPTYYPFDISTKSDTSDPAHIGFYNTASPTVSNAGVYLADACAANTDYTVRINLPASTTLVVETRFDYYGSEYRWSLKIVGGSTNKAALSSALSDTPRYRTVISTSFTV